MVEESSDSNTSRGRLIITILVVISVIIASIAIGYVILAPERTISGTVTDAKGVPLEGAMVSANGISVNTATDGGFQLSVNSWGKFVVQAEADGHWTQRLWAGKGNGHDILNFNLTEDQERWVVTCIAYVHYLEDGNLTTLIKVQSEWPAYLYIDDYAAGDEKALRPISEGNGYLGSERYNATSYGMVTRVMVSGVYWDEPGACENCYAKIAGRVDKYVEDSMDYLDIEDVPSDQGQFIFDSTVGPGGQVGYPSQVDHDIHLPPGLCVQVNVTILGEDFITTLPVIYRATTSASYFVQVDCFSEGPYRVYGYKEGGWIIHIWQIPPE